MRHRSFPPRRWRLGLLCALALIGICLTPAAMSQIAEPAETVDPLEHHHMHMGGAHIMNFALGEETCAPEYTYTAGPAGPDHWPGLCRTGNMQAPIDIRDAQKLPLGGLLKISYQPVSLDVINDCNHYRLLVRFPDNEWLKIGKKPYLLSELHFRTPGENAVNGRRPRMSVQLVHLDPESTIAIIEVPVVPGRENPAMKAVLAHVPGPGKEIKVSDVQINAQDFLPQDRSFYRVPGSLTTPICNEVVTWYVMRHPIAFSEAQITAYTRAYPDTARPLQPSHGRPVAESD
jgi:carbonic anhydrase